MKSIQSEKLLTFVAETRKISSLTPQQAKGLKAALSKMPAKHPKPRHSPVKVLALTEKFKEEKPVTIFEKLKKKLKP